MAASLRACALYTAWLISVVATLGSLYFSEGLGYVPCEFCWYQRIAMYPLVLLLGIAAFYHDTKIVPYVLPLSIIGGLVSVYHYLMQKIPGFAAPAPCADGVPCHVLYINWFGFITIPFLALTAFALITALLVLLHVKKK
ncbi:disulfide bond formation protein B [Salibacterium salarium]|uniref:Probable disulfide formation protein n=1 Tax=Salibacterium salarium TaxID=284579 RepID=A0A3R9R907_9BACI|nr:disulfide oxidoreductase [Salibacterium salarium]RSL29976.1 disulfide bond formation protein B [Salibacterium salarium]